ncbi:MAG: hypothetical protein FWE15_27985 [Actinomycetia bacterium]|nr:hypothetical protein [Actinomycetes bacterium]
MSPIRWTWNPVESHWYARLGGSRWVTVDGGFDAPPTDDFTRRLLDSL